MFLFLVYYSMWIKKNLKSVFFGLNRHILDNQEKTKISGLSGVSGAGRQKYIPVIDSAGQKNRK